MAVKTLKNHGGSGASSATVSSQTGQAKKACAIFTLSDAKMLLGENTKGGKAITDDSSSDLTVSSCTYTQDTGDNLPTASTKTATLLVRAPASDKGQISNQNQFGPLKPETVQDVSGYGDSAYWDASHGQLNVLKNNTWYVLSFGPTSPADRTLDQARQLADLLINKM